MSTGLAIPVRVSSSGGFAKSSGEDHDKDIIWAALGSDENENAFQQDLGLGDAMIFEINDQEFRAKMSERLRVIFARFERLKRYRLLEETIDWTDVPGEQIVFFKYVNLESDKVQDFQKSLASLGAR